MPERRLERTRRAYDRQDTRCVCGAAWNQHHAPECFYLRYVDPVRTMKAPIEPPKSRDILGAS
jgi:hypothetical protein